MHAHPSEPDPLSDPARATDVLTALMQRHAAWVAALAAVSCAAAGGRDRLIAAEIAPTQLEELAPHAGLLLADALAGHAPDLRAELLRRLSDPPLGDSAAAQTPFARASVEEGPADPGPPELLEIATAPAAVSAPDPERKPLALPQPVALTDAHVARLKASLNGELKSPAPDRERHQVQALESFRKRLGGAPPRLATRGDLLNLLRQVELTLDDSRTLDQLGPRGRRLALEGLAARIRAIQHAQGDLAGVQAHDRIAERTAGLLRELRRHTESGKTDRFVWGLAANHQSKAGDWLEDARQLQHELADEVGLAPAPEGATAFSVDDAFRRLREDGATLPSEQLAQRICELRANGVSESDKRWVKTSAPSTPAGLALPTRRASARRRSKPPFSSSASTGRTSQRTAPTKPAP